MQTSYLGHCIELSPYATKEQMIDALNHCSSGGVVLGENPNQELVEINVREAIFYPDGPGRNYITIRGFRLAHAATQWAAPTERSHAIPALAAGFHKLARTQLAFDETHSFALVRGPPVA